jgi:hypothetical protein
MALRFSAALSWDFAHGGVSLSLLPAAAGGAFVLRDMLWTGCKSPAYLCLYLLITTQLFDR